MKRLVARYWAWLGSGLCLTLAGRVVFTIVAALGLAGVVGDDTTGGISARTPRPLSAST